VKKPADDSQAGLIDHLHPKRLIFVGSALKAMHTMPEAIMDKFGYDLWLIQNGETPAGATPFEGAHGGNIMKLSERMDGETYRRVYAAKLLRAAFVLHVFQKKSKLGIATPQSEINLVHARFSSASQLYESLFSEGDRQ